MSAEYPDALWIPHDKWGYPQGQTGRNGQTLKYVILHGTASGGTAQDQANNFAHSSRQAGTHFIIGQDGTVVQCCFVENAAWGNGGPMQGAEAFWPPNVNCNLLTVSIEHVKPSSDNSDILTPAQQSASFELVAWLCKTYAIPTKKAVDASGGITGHYSIDPVNRSRCPGPYPWDALFSFLGGAMVPKGPFVWPTVGKEIPAGTTLQQIADSFGLSVSDVKALNNWSASYNETIPGVIDGLEIKLPGYPQPLPPDPRDAEIAALKQKLAQIATLASS